LFGLDKAKTSIRIKDYSILVEGQMDLIMLHQVGITNTVASSGTALTENHLIKLRRLSNRIIMAYDGDSAGFAASDRSSKLALSLGMELKIAEMPGGKDPADLAKEDQTSLIEALKGSKHIIDFYADSLLSRNLGARELGQEIRKHVLPYVAILTSSIEKSHFIKSIAQKTFIKEEALWDDLKTVAVNSVETFQKEKENLPMMKRIEIIERKVIGVLMWQKGNKSRESAVVDIEKRVKEIFGERLETLMETFEKERELLLFETEAYYNNKANLSRDLEELVIGLEEEYLKKEFSLAMIALQKAEQEKNSSEILKYLEECQRISNKINTINTIKNVYEKK
jgi:DNA primase